MTRDETVALWQRCEEARQLAQASGQSESDAHEAAKSVWNSWANELLSRRVELEKSGQWCSAVRQSENSYVEVELGDNQQSQAWLSEAFVDFSKLNFVPVDGALIDADLEHLKPSRTVMLEQWASRLNFRNLDLASRTLDFSGFIFPGSCDFFGTRFFVPVYFSRALFYGSGGFRRSYFFDPVDFDNAKFKSHAWFSRTKFCEQANFSSAEFMGLARFAGAYFQDIAVFLNTKFHNAWFLSVIFTGRAEFNGSVFYSDADFIACQSGRAFLLSRVAFVEQPPNFTQATFNQAPDLDDVKFPLPSFWRRGEEGLIAKYRAIRRVAIQGADYEREQMAFKGEIRSKRGTEHRWYHAAFWYGLAYDALSDFGRSMSRPSLIWLISIAVFALFYLANSGKWGSAFADCAAAGAPNYESALIISWKNALPFIGIDSKAEEIARGCLYGAAVYGGIAIQGLQKVWSAVLIFLFLLAVRNQFKIK